MATFNDERDNPVASNSPELDEGEAKRRAANHYPFDWDDLPSSPGRDGAEHPGGEEGCEVFTARCAVDDCDARIGIQGRKQDVEHLGRRQMWQYVWRGAYDNGWKREGGDWYCAGHHDG